MASKDEQKLSNFAEELDGLLKDYQSDQILDQQTKSHQRTLEKLLDRTNKILNEDASDEDYEQFDELLKYSKKSYKAVQQQNRDNEEFQEAFQRKFGDETGAGSLNRRIMEKLSTNLTEVASSVNVLNSNAAQDVSDTALNFATGPFGAMIKESLDLSGITGLIKSKFSGTDSQREVASAPAPASVSEQSKDRRQFEATERQKEGTSAPDPQPVYVSASDSGQFKDRRQFETVNKVITKTRGQDDFDSRSTQRVSSGDIKGQLDAGINRVPQKGTYILDKDERVIPPEQNKDLSQFLETVKDAVSGSNVREQPEKDRVVRIFNQASSSEYWKPLKDHNSQLHSETLDTLRTNNKKTIGELQWLRRMMSQETQDQIDAWLQSFNLFYQRFARHPILNSIRLAMKPLGFVMGKIGEFLFGKKKSDTDRIVESNEKIVDFLRKGSSETKKTFLQRMNFAGGRALGNVASRALTGKRAFQSAQELEDKRARGESLGSNRVSRFFNERYLDKAQPYVTQRTFGSGGGQVGGASQRKRSILAGDEMREQDAMEEAVVKSWHTLEEIKELLEGYKGFGEKDDKKSGSGGIMGRIKSILTGGAIGLGAIASALGMSALGMVGIMGLFGITAYGIYKVAKKIWDNYWAESENEKRRTEIAQLKAERDAAKDAGESDRVKELNKQIKKLMEEQNPNASSEESRTITPNMRNEDGSVKVEHRNAATMGDTAATRRQLEAAGRDKDGNILPRDERVRPDFQKEDDRTLEEQRKNNEYQSEGNTLLEEVREQLKILNRTVKQNGGDSVKGQKGPPPHAASQSVAEGN